jgi:inorganic triphosphatase YgiF
VDRYLDTADGRLAAAGWACRLRSRDGAVRVSLKGPPRQPAGSALHLRPELEGPAKSADDPSGWPSSEARDLVTTLSEGAPLFERLTLVQRRVERRVTLAGQPAGILSLDIARVRIGGAEHGVLHVVELELDAAALEAGLDPQRLAAALTALDGLEAEAQNKLERALALAGIS